MHKLKATLFNVNDFSIEQEYIIDLIKEFPLDTKALNLIGLTINDIHFSINNTDRISLYVLSKLFEKYEITRGEQRDGHPDYILSKGNDLIYIEIKTENDSLRKSQFEWFCKHKKSNNKVLWLTFDDSLAIDSNI